MANESLVFEVGADSSAFTREMGRLEDYTKKSSDRINNELNSLGKGMRLGDHLSAAKGQIAGAVTSILALTAAVDTVSASLDRFGKVADKSFQTGMSTELLQKLSVAAEASGGNIDQLAAAAGRLAKAITFGKDADLSVQALSALGFRLEDLRQGNPDETFINVAKAIGSIEDPIQRAAAAMAVFGKSGADLVPTFGEIAKGIADITTLTGRQVDQLDRAQDAWQKFKGADVQTSFGKVITDIQDFLADPLTPPAQRKAKADAKWKAEQEAGTSTAEKGPDFAAMLKAQEDAQAAEKAAADAQSKAAETAKKAAEDEARRIERNTNAKNAAMAQRLANIRKLRGEPEKEPGSVVVAASPSPSPVFGTPSAPPPPARTPGTLDSEQRLQDFLADPDSYNADGSMKDPGALRKLDRAAGNDRGREDRRQDRGINASPHPSALSEVQQNVSDLFGGRYNGDGTTSAAGLADQFFGRGKPEFLGPPVPDITHGQDNASARNGPQPQSSSDPKLSSIDSGIQGVWRILDSWNQK